jgi:hypothetical protein
MLHIKSVAKWRNFEAGKNFSLYFNHGLKKDEQSALRLQNMDVWD